MVPLRSSAVSLLLLSIKRGLNRIFALLDHEVVKVNRGLIQPWEEDLFFQKVWTEVISQTTPPTDTTKLIKCYILKNLLLASAPLQEHMAECGVYQGATAITLASYLKEYELLQPGRKLLLFDSFEGLSMPDRKLDGEFFQKGDFSADLSSVQQRVKNFDFIEFWPGWIPSRFDENSERRFSFVHVDVDLYQPIKDCLEFFYPRLVEGGMMVFDDYGFVSCPGAKKAVDEYAQFHNQVPIWFPSGQAVIIKKK